MADEVDDSEIVKNMVRDLNEILNKDIEDVDFSDEVHSAQVQDGEMMMLAVEEEYNEDDVIAQFKETETGTEYKVYIEEI